MELLEPVKVAQMLGISTSSLEKWRRRGEGPPFARVGRQIRYPCAALEKWVASQTQSSDASAAKDQLCNPRVPSNGWPIRALQRDLDLSERRWTGTETMRAVPASPTIES